MAIKTMVSKVSKGQNPLDSGLSKMEIIAFTKSTFKDEHARYKVQFNPTSLKHDLHVEYVDEKAPNSTNEQKKLLAAPSQKLNITLTLDATGVTGQTGQTGSKGTFGLTGDKLDIIKEIEAFKEATYYFIGSSHDIPYVKIIWGTNKFEGRLVSLSISHTMFKANGDPLRSVIDATFESSQEASTQAKVKDLQSPDLTHIRTVQTGDTLPLMCQGIYNDSSFYLKVAKFNNLVDFRNIEPGTEIIFPPVV